MNNDLFLEYTKSDKAIQDFKDKSFFSELLDINKLIKANNLKADFNEQRKHHEIYLSDPRRCKTENLKTVIRIPVK